MSAADSRRGGLGQADVSHFSLCHEFGQGAHGVFDGGLGIDPVLVIQVDMVGAEPLQGAFDRRADVRRAAVESSWAAAGVGDDAELRGQHDLMTAILDARPTSSSFA